MKKIVVAILLCVLTLTLIGCESTTSYSTGGASLTFSTQRDDKTLELKDPGTTFKAGQEFYFVFNNNGPFNSNEIKVELLDTNGKSMVSQAYTVKQDSTMYSNTMGFDKPGKYQMKAYINDKVVAKQDLIIN